MLWELESLHGCSQQSEFSDLKQTRVPVTSLGEIFCERLLLALDSWIQDKWLLIIRKAAGVGNCKEHNVEWFLCCCAAIGDFSNHVLQ